MESAGGGAAKSVPAHSLAAPLPRPRPPRPAPPSMVRKASLVTPGGGTGKGMSTNDKFNELIEKQIRDNLALNQGQHDVVGQTDFNLYKLQSYSRDQLIRKDLQER